MLTNLKNNRLMVLLLALALVGLAACDNMVDQPKLDQPYGESEVFGTAARNILPEAVPVGFEREDELFHFGTVDGQLADELPIELTEEVFTRGRHLYEQLCSPCHGMSGYGNGVLSEEGFPQPASYHTDYLRGVQLGSIYQTITYGQGAMYSYGSRIPQVEDRWAIVAYIRALQLSQFANYDALPEEFQASVDNSDSDGE